VSHLLTHGVPLSPDRGGPLTETDYASLSKSWITTELADQAGLRRVTSPEGAAIIGRSDTASYSGIVFPYLWPGERHIREYWLRRDQPDIEYDAEGHPKEKNKYLGPPGRGNLLYFVPGTPKDLLEDVRVPVVITEGAKKTLALYRLSLHERPEAEQPRFLPVGLGGVWNWRGTIGKAQGPDGSRRDEKGPIPDLSRLAWSKRIVYVVFDANVHTNSSVAAARQGLTSELRRRGARVLWVNLPTPGPESVINGVDDMLAESGPDRVLGLFEEAEEPSKQRSPSQVELLIDLARAVQLFHTPDLEAYARVPVNGHHETWLLRDGFANWLVKSFYDEFGKPPGAQALQDAIGILDTRARFDSPSAPLHTRVAEYQGRIVIDLADAQWRAVEIGPDGWRVQSDLPVHFRRTTFTRPLPIPVAGTPLGLLRKHINAGNDSNWILIASWMLAACRPRGPYPVLILQGEQGSAKSTMQRMLRRIIDPAAAPIRTPPRNERELLIAAINSWVLAYDNLSGVSPWLSDSFCRLATGGGMSTRALYSDSKEVLFEATRPIILNGIDHIAERADLADRALVLHLPSIGDGDRLDEETLYADFERDLPQIFGALLTTVSGALHRLPQIKLERKPRMADFARWATAGELALGFTEGAFMNTYTGNRAEAVRETLEGDAVGGALLQMMSESVRESEVWEGTAGELQEALGRFIPDGVRHSKTWAVTPRALSGRLRRLATFLRESGIDVTFHQRGAKGRRILTIIRTGTYFTATTASTVTQNESGPPNQLLADQVAGGGSSTKVAVDPPPGSQPPPPKADRNLLEGRRAQGEGGGGDGGGGVLQPDSNGNSQPSNLCPECGPVDWEWIQGTWACPNCGAVAGAVEVDPAVEIERFEL
jgi:Domain of unknown function (DUF3854)